MGEMYKKTSKKHKATIGALAIIGMAVNFEFNSHVSTSVWIGIAGGFGLAFSIMYGVRSNWSLTPAGRADFWMKLSFSTLALWILSGLWFGTEWHFREEVRDWLFLAYALASVNAFMALWGVQHREIHNMELPEHPPRDRWRWRKAQG